MLITNDHPNSKDENARKFFDPKLLTSTECSIDNLDQMLVKVDQTRSVRLIKENERSKKEVKCLVKKNSDPQDHLLGACRSLWEELRTREREEVDSTLRDGSLQDIDPVENV